jgi:hypothetical protein
MELQRPAGLLTVRDLARLGNDGHDQRRAFGRGHAVRLKRGAYFDARQWAALDPRTRHLARMHAITESHRDPIFGFESAACAHGFSTLENWPDVVHVVANRASGGRSEPGIQRHCVGIDDEDIMDIGGLTVTRPLRTLVDLARSRSFAEAVVSIDSALRVDHVSREELADASARNRHRRGAAAIRHAFAFGDGMADNAGESLSRVLISQLGFPRPELQVPYRRPDGGADIVDFAWPKFRLLGEFDGRGKYLKEAYLRGRTPGDAVYDEKRREDRLRTLGNRMSRWGWTELRDSNALRSILLAAGLPIVR